MIRSNLSMMRSEWNSPLNKIRREANKELTQQLQEKKAIIRLKDLREKSTELNKKKKAAYEKYIADNKDLFSEIDKLGEQITSTEEEIKIMALIQYGETGEKKLNYGVGIRILKKLEYEDATALQWAKEHNMALSLDKRNFDKIARADPMDFVKINMIPQATLPCY